MNTTTLEANPEVSVILPIHNRDAYLRPAIDSILNQTLQNFELIIVNDGSSNAECLKIVRDYESRDKRVQVISQENSGLATARNTGIDAARGAYIAFMDDDDISEPTRLEKLASYLNEHEGIGAVTPLYAHINTSGRTIGQGYSKRDLVQSPIIYTADSDIYKNAFSIGSPRDADIYRLVSKTDPDIRKRVFQTLCWLFTPAMYQARILKTLKFNPLFSVAEDLDLSLRCMEQHAVAVIPECLFQYRIYEKDRSSLSTTPLINYYNAVAFLCALYRRQGKPEPLQESTDVRDLLPFFKELPFPTVAYCLKGLRHKLKRLLISRQDDWIFTLLADMDKAFLDSEHAAYYAHVRKQACRKLKMTALKRGKFAWLIKNYQRLARP